MAEFSFKNNFIPETLFGLPVNAIQDRALTDALNLNSITIPTSIATVGKRVFRGCDNLLNKAPF